MAGRAKVTFRFEPEVARPLLSSPAMRELLTGLTKDVSDSARRLAPRLLGFVIESIEPEVLAGEDVTGGLVGRVTAKDFKAAWHEFGTRHMLAHPFLFPALTQELPGATITRGSRRG